jgi:hypothetical protein
VTKEGTRASFFCHLVTPSPCHLVILSPYNPAMSLFPVVQIVYWLALATWFGGVLFIAVAAPIIIRTVRDAKPILPSVLSVNLDNQHGTLLAGSIVANLLEVLTRFELICAGGMFLGLMAQWFLVDRSTWSLAAMGVRTALFFAALIVVVYDWRIVWPRIQKHRQEYLDHADEPDVANPAKESFDRYHKESVLMLSIVLFLLLGIVLFSGNIVPNSGSSTGQTVTFK